MIAKERMYQTADKKELVGHGDKKSAFLFSGIGNRIEDAIAKKYGLVDGRMAPTASSPERTVGVKDKSVDNKKAQEKLEEMEQLRRQTLIEAGMVAGENGYRYRTMFAYKEEVRDMKDEEFDVFLKALEMNKTEADKDQETVSDPEGSLTRWGEENPGESKEADHPEDKEVKTTENKAIYPPAKVAAPAESKRTKKVIKKRK